MSLKHGLDWIPPPDYYGRILPGDYSLKLKKKLSGYIDNFLEFDGFSIPAIPYISAWNLQKKNIWYEFASSKLCELLNCGQTEVAGVFKQRVIQRCQYQKKEKRQIKEILTREQLSGVRGELREQGEQRGNIEAVYKISLSPDGIIWLKDQANIEIFAEEKICLSRGILIDVTKEMEAEEELKQVQNELRLHRRHLEDMVKDRTRKLWKSQLEIVTRLARAAEFRDSQTGLHISKMSKYCAILGRAAGLEKNINLLLYHAAPMHDVGKIGITDRILLKPGKLSSAEFELMKKHCYIGAKLLSGDNSGLLRMARSIALNHHEKWNGSGYPRGLANSKIPLTGRITAICDVFDALTSDRPYKKAWPLDSAVKEVIKEKGNHFDPHLVDLFIRNLPTIQRIHAGH